ncbi:hypothetical protein P9273_09640 [Mesorhizobium sp. WSM4935]|uniref:hypothetical protein n=1 Tax=Mesorhizobium sp. WSM4935 TaxID=3038547 RepID=UPI0024152577|nr:hypothetical protein [Mesorhizobium sp. WSM4935]MDG4875357.1 hypothetical protein [Mesorhizobium sp. WSM4935]
MTETVTVKSEGMTLSALLARHYRNACFGMVAKTFALNQDLAASGPYMPFLRQRSQEGPTRVILCH